MIRKCWEALKAHRWLRWLTVIAVSVGGLVALSNVGGGTGGGGGPSGGSRSRSSSSPSQSKPSPAWGDGLTEENLAHVATSIKNRSAETIIKSSAGRVQTIQDELAEAKAALRRMQEAQEKTSAELSSLKDELLVNRARAANPGDPAVPQQELEALRHTALERLNLDGGPASRDGSSPFSSPTSALDSAGSRSVNPGRIRKVDLAPKGMAERKKTTTKMVHVPAGTFVRARLLTGVYAPINSSALPVLLKVESLGWGPNRSRVPIREAFIVGKAQGDAGSVRATIQLQTLALVLEDGRAIEVSVNGYVADSDGVQGVAGTYVYRMKDVLVISATAGILSQGADAFSQRDVTSSIGPLGNVQKVISGDAVEYAGLQTASGTLKKLSDIVARRADEIVPAVYAANGKQMTAVFIQGVDLGIEVSDDDEAISRNLSGRSGIGWEGSKTLSNGSKTPWEGLDAHK